MTFDELLRVLFDIAINETQINYSSDGFDDGVTLTIKMSLAAYHNPMAFIRNHKRADEIIAVIIGAAPNIGDS